MKPNTMVVCGFRNVGDAADPGEFVEMTLRDALAHVINKLGQVSMATRIQICLARNEQEARRGLGLGVGRGNANKSHSVNLLDDLLGGFIDETTDDAIMHSAPMPRDPRDTYSED